MTNHNYYEPLSAKFYNYNFSIDIQYTEIIFCLKCYTNFQADY